MVRIEEMQAVAAGSCANASKRCRTGPVRVDDRKIAPPPRAEMKQLDGSADPSLQAVHRRLPRAGRRDLYARSRAPKGEFGVYLVSDGTNKPYRCKIRRARLRASAGDRLHVARAHAGRRGRQSSAPSTSCSARSTDEQRATTGLRQPASFAFTPRESGAGQGDHRQISGGPPAQRGDAAAGSGAAPGRLGVAGGDGLVAEMLDMAPIRVYEVATFYTMFQLKPVGQVPSAGLHHLPCMLRGSDEVVGLQERTGHRRRAKPPPTASSPCPKSNAWAPASMRRWSWIGDDYYEDLTPTRPRQADRRLEARRDAEARIADRPQRLGAGRRSRPTLRQAEHAAEVGGDA